MKNIIKINNHQLTTRDLLLLVCTCFLSHLVQGEVTLDGSLGSAGALTGPDYQVTENLGKRAGSNLFHSFGRFNLNASESVTFSGSANINNVIGRVTGGQASHIDGTLRVSIPNANLYLLNPAGVIFGKNSQLDVPGSFHVSTADYLKFQDGVRFDSGVATTPQVLASAEPEAFGFLGENPAGISLSGDTGSVLEVAKGSTLSLIGGDITNDNTAIYAPGGQINLVSVGSAGEVSFNESGIQTTSFQQMGNIRINQNPLVQLAALGTGFIISNIDTSDDNAGKIFIRGGQLVMDNSFIASNTANGNGGGIKVGLTGDLSLGHTKTSEIEPSTSSAITSITVGEGNAGNINIDVAGLKLTNGTRIDTRASSSSIGNAGNLSVNANIIQLQNDDSKFVTQLTTASLGEGDAGNIAINTDKLQVHDAAIIDSSTQGEGHGGNLTVDAEKVMLSGENSAFVTSALPGGTGDAGNLSVKADTMEVNDGALITSNTSGAGEGGDLKINASSLKVNNAIIFNTTDNTGNGGDLMIKAETMYVGRGALITSNNTGTGIGGNLIIKSDVLDMTDGGLIQSSIFNSGKGGNLIVSANNLLIQNGASITINNLGTDVSGSFTVDAGNIFLSRNSSALPTGIINAAGNAGSIGELTVNAESLHIQNGAIISAPTFGSADGGKLNVNSRLISLSGDGRQSFTGITTSSFLGSTGNAGHLTIKSDDLKVHHGADIVASTQGKGDAGDLTIKADHLEVSNSSSIATISGSLTSGNSGVLTINADQLEVLNNSFISTSTLGSGDGGNLNINASKIAIREQSHLSATTGGTGSGGDLTLVTDDIVLSNHATVQSASVLEDFDNSNDLDIARSGKMVITFNGTLRLENDSRITTVSEQANAGNIIINNGDLIFLSNESAIQTRVLDSQGKGGNIFINTPIVALDNSVIGAQAAEGQGGNITIKGFLFKSPSSLVSASSKLGIDGELNLKPDTHISGSIAELPDTFIDASQQLSQRCVARSGNSLSSFVIKGRGGVPLSPGNLAPSNFLDYLTDDDNSLQNKGSEAYKDRSSHLMESYQFESMSFECRR